MRSITLRSWATPLTIGSFLLMATTGMLMFFEQDPGLTAVAHQWCSWFFLAGAAGHIGANVRPFKNQLQSSLGKASAAFFALVLIASLFSWGLLTGPQIRRPIEQALVDAPISALASVIHTDPDRLIDRLRKHGIVAAPHQTIGELARTQGVGENRLLGIVFLPD